MQWKVSDGGVFRNCNLFTAVETTPSNIPNPEPLIGDRSFPLPYMFVSDDAFPLKEYIQKPFGQVGLTTEKRIFNYRLSHA